jgi:hypothetical protein
MQMIPRLLMLDYLSSKLISYVSMEILWRNIMICYDQCSSSHVQTCLLDAYLDSIKAGYAFEIIDGDNFYLPHRFLTKVFTKFDGNEQRILVISILGPRQSGKSTLLQYMFGIKNSIRSTKGLYGSFVKSNVDAFDSILVLDIEGLDQDDNEYDRRMAFFCMSISHLIILNVSNDIPDRFIDMISICNDSFQRLFGNHCQSSIIHLVLNPISFFNTNDTSNKTRKQYHEHFVSKTNLNITPDAIHVLPVAFQKDFSSTRIYSEPNFCEYTQELSMKILRSSSKVSPIILSQWLNTAILFFDTIQEKPTISSFQSLTERSHDDYILDYIRRYLVERLTPEYQQQLFESVANKSRDEIDQIFNAILVTNEDRLQRQVDDRLNIIKASKSIRERSRNFLQRHLIETFDEWRREAKTKTKVLEIHKKPIFNKKTKKS